MPGKHPPGIYPRGTDAAGREKWLIRYELPRRDGERQQKSETFIGTEKEAVKRRRDILYEIDHGTFFIPEKDISVAEYMKNWLEKYELDHAESTYKGAKSLVKNHVINEFGNLELEKLSPYMIDKLYTKMQKTKKLASSTVRSVHTYLHQALERAVALGLIPENPVLKVKAPPLRQREPKPFTDEEIARFLEAIKGNRHEFMFITLLGTGMRLGESINLTWDNLDFSEKTIIVINLFNDDEGDEKTDAKTECSKRTIPMFPSVEKALKAQHSQQASEKLLAGPMYEDNNLVFANKVGKPLNPSNVRNRYFNPLLASAGLKGTPHTLRHTFTTTLIRKGVDMRIVSAWIGHSRPGFTFSKYHHYLPPHIDSREAERINNLIFKLKEKTG